MNYHETASHIPLCLGRSIMCTRCKEIFETYFKLSENYNSPVNYDEYLDKILLAMYKTGKTASSKEIVQKDASLKDNRCVGRAAAFLNYLGLVDGKKSRFKLSESGRDIALALEEKRNERARTLWQQSLKAHDLYSQLQKYVSEQGGKRGTPLGFADYLRKLADKKWGTMFLREGGKRLCTLFAKKGLLTFNREDDFISFQKDTPPPTPPTTPPTIPPAPPPSVPSTLPSAQGNLPYSINITVEAKDADSIKQLIELIKELTRRKPESS